MANFALCLSHNLALCFSSRGMNLLPTSQTASSIRNVTLSILNYLIHATKVGAKLLVAILLIRKVKSKDKFHPRTGHDGPERE